VREFRAGAARAVQPPTRIESSASPPATPPPTCASWKFALVAGAFEPVQDLTLDKLIDKWRTGAIAADETTAAALAPVLGAHEAGDATWAIVPAHELVPDNSVITVDGKHPLTTDVLAGEVCGPNVVPNIDPTRLTTLVMSARPHSRAAPPSASTRTASPTPFATSSRSSRARTSYTSATRSRSCAGASHARGSRS